MVAVLTREGSSVAYHIPVLLQKIEKDVFLASNEDLGIYVQGDSEQYVMEQVVESIKAYVQRFGTEELEPYKDADVRVVDI